MSKCQKYPLIPSLENPESQIKVFTALEQRNEADYRCYQLLEKLLLGVSTKALSELYASHSLETIEEATEFFEECHDAIKARQDANIAFLRAVAGA